MSASKRILLAHNERIARQTLARDLTQKGYDVRATEGFDPLWRWVRAGEGDLVLIDVDITDPARNGFELLKQIREAYPHIPVLVLSAENTVLTSLLSARFGAFDYFPKPFSFEQLAASIGRALPVGEVPKVKTSTKTDLPLVGTSDVMQTVYRLIAQATQSNLPVLITGETGTGKSLVAKMLHEYSNNAEGNCTIVNFPLDGRDFSQELEKCTAYPKGGTLILDEISAATAEQQAYLISFLSRLDAQSATLRIVSTTRQNLGGEGIDAPLSHQLLYRLNTIPMHLPPLREREGDVIELAQTFLAKVSKNTKTLSRQAENSLTGRAWPGNVRELQNTIERASLMAKTDRVCPEDIEWTTDKVPQGDADSAVEDAISRALAIYFGRQEGRPLAPDLYPQILGSLERPLLRQIMGMAAGNQLKAARMLGINRNTLHKKLVHYRLLP
ncbi:MAG: hypothetical protein COA85_01025 [Robiginitomaculum sp.]|nr:MAG: hypothetical protein COA85_01025 [Robiginitomaculum sp.]